MSLKIYGVPKSRAIRTLWMAHELGLDYELVDVPAGADGSRRPEYLRLNPNGRVPFIDDDGLVLWESLAINLYLARKHGGPLAGSDIAEDGLLTMWTVWALTELEPLASKVMIHTALLPPAERDPAVVASSLAALAAPLRVLEEAIVRGGGHVAGGRFTVADLNLACVTFYLRFVPEVLAARPVIRDWYAAALARPAARAAYALRGE